MMRSRFIIFCIIFFCFAFFDSFSQVQDNKVLFVRPVSKLKTELVKRVLAQMDIAFKKKFNISNEQWNMPVNRNLYVPIINVVNKTSIRVISDKEKLSRIIVLEENTAFISDGIYTINVFIYELNPTGAIQGKLLNRFSIPFNEKKDNGNDITDLCDYFSERCFCFINNISKKELSLRSHAAIEHTVLLNDYFFKPIKAHTNLCSKYIIKPSCYKTNESVSELHIDGIIMPEGNNKCSIKLRYAKGMQELYPVNENNNVVDSFYIQDYLQTHCTLLVNYIITH